MSSILLLFCLSRFTEISPYYGCIRPIGYNNNYSTLPEGESYTNRQHSWTAIGTNIVCRQLSLLDCLQTAQSVGGLS